MNCRHISIERSISVTSPTTLAPVVEKPDIDSKSGVDRVGELRLAEQVRQRAEHGHQRPDQRHDEIALARADPLLAVGKRLGAGADRRT